MTVIATAGHVDHGKTSLIRQLTGVETDRLAEEQRRGLSINLGHAYLPRPRGTPLGFIDVPGHQRFINTMISGISGIDMGMLVVAADDGPMPQTHEHLDVLQLLGIEQLTLVISKIDRVDAQRLQAVQGFMWLKHFSCEPHLLALAQDPSVEVRRDSATESAAST